MVLLGITIREGFEIQKALFSAAIELDIFAHEKPKKSVRSPMTINMYIHVSITNEVFDQEKKRRNS
jgi:hypothetical protein